MTTSTLAASKTTALRADRRSVVKAIRFIRDHFLLLPLGAAVALVWANTASESYFRFSLAWAWPVNEIGMAFFLALIGQHVYEVVMPGGALHTWRHWALPIAGAAGGFIGAAMTFAAVVALVHEAPLLQAWPVACAVDLAAAYLVLRMIYPNRSRPLAFVLVLAVATDLVVIAVVTLQAPGFRFVPAAALLLLVALGLAAGLRVSNVRSFWPYWIGCGSLSWLSFYLMGVHPALALVPIVPLLPHGPRPIDAFDDRLDADPIHRAEHQWNEVAQVALFLFGLVNAGVILKHYDSGTWAVIIAAVAGRPAGILAGIGLAVAAGLRLPHGVTWRDLLVIALATTSGFTFALFVTTAVVPIGAVSSQITLGALLTAVGAGVTFLAARQTGAARFGHRRAD